MQVVEAKGRAGRPPGTRANRVGLTSRQAAVIHFIEQQVASHGYPPSMREIGQAVGLKSSSSVSHQLMSLERNSLLNRRVEADQEGLRHDALASFLGAAGCGAERVIR